MCDFPINIANPLFKTHPTNERRILVPCGKCVKCNQRKANHWYIRLYNELKTATSAYFVTLTYEAPPRSFNGYQTVNKEDLQKYFKRLRKRELNNKDIKYYAVSEYGEKYHRPHYHAIVFNVKDERNIHNAWKYPYTNTPIGLTHTGTVQKESILYVAGYIGKRIGIPLTDDDDRTKEFSLMSKSMGLYYIDKAKTFHEQTETGFTIIDGIKYNLPRYYKEKIWKPEYIDRMDHIKHIESMLDHPAQLKMILKHSPHLLQKKQRKNQTLTQISKRNYEYFIQNQTKSMANFPTVMAWEKNSLEVRIARNFNKSNIINPKF